MKQYQKVKNQVQVTLLCASRCNPDKNMYGREMEFRHSENFKIDPKKMKKRKKKKKKKKKKKMKKISQAF